MQLKYYSRNKDSKQLLDMLVKHGVFIVRGDVTWREIIIYFVKPKQIEKVKERNTALEKTERKESFFE